MMFLASVSWFDRGLQRINVASDLLSLGSTLFAVGRYLYRAWTTNPDLTPVAVWRFYEGRVAMEPRIRELREDFALRKIPTASF